MYTILIDQHRTIWDDTDVSPVPQHIVDTETSMRAAGATPTRVAVTTWPANYRRGRVLSSDNSRCDDPTDSHPPRLVGARRSRVVAWAKKNTGHGFLLRSVRDINADRNTGTPDDARHEGRPPHKSAIWLAFVHSTLAAAFADANLLNAAVWEAMERNMEYGADDLPNLSVANWKDKFVRLDAYTVFVKAGATLAAGPTDIALPTAVGVGAIAWAEDALFGGGR